MAQNERQQTTTTHTRAYSSNTPTNTQFLRVMNMLLHLLFHLLSLFLLIKWLQTQKKDELCWLKIEDQLRNF